MQSTLDTPGEIILILLLGLKLNHRELCGPKGGGNSEGYGWMTSRFGSIAGRHLPPEHGDQRAEDPPGPEANILQPHTEHNAGQKDAFLNKLGWARDRQRKYTIRRRQSRISKEKNTSMPWMDHEPIVVALL